MRDYKTGFERNYIKMHILKQLHIIWTWALHNYDRYTFDFLKVSVIETNALRIRKK